jgi:hypothetical protein
MDRNRNDQLYEALRLIDGEQFDIAINVLKKTIGEAVSHNREDLTKRSDSFLNGAIKQLSSISEAPMNALSPKYAEFRREVDERKQLASKCLETVIETEGGSRFLEGKHGGLMREGLRDDNGMESRFLDRMNKQDERAVKQYELMAEFMGAMMMRDEEQAEEPAAGDGTADRQEPEYLLKWAESTNGKKHGVWIALFMLQAFRDEVEAMANEQKKMAPVLKAYWNKYESILNDKGSFNSFRRRFGGHDKCRKLFPE